MRADLRELELEDGVGAAGLGVHSGGRHLRMGRKNEAGLNHGGTRHAYLAHFAASVDQIDNIWVGVAA